MFQYHFTMKRLLLITLCTCFLLTEGKTQSIPDTLKKLNISDLPFQITHKDYNAHSYDISTLADKIPIGTSYKDMNATLIDKYPDEGPDITLQFRLPDQEGRYFFFADARYACDSSISDYLILMDKDGTVSDYLWAGLFFSTGKHLFPMSFKIDESGLITVYRIQSDPKSKAIDPNDESITSFKGQRTDTTYQIENGKFVLKNTKNYPQKVYRMSDLVNGRFIFDTKEAFKEDDFFL